MARKKTAKTKIVFTEIPEGAPPKAYENPSFLHAAAARPVRILSEMLEPQNRFRKNKVRDSIVFFGSARTLPSDVAQQNLDEAKSGKDKQKIKKAEADLKMSKYYDDAVTLGSMLTEWSIDHNYRYFVCTGGGPGIMEAGNRGADQVEGGKSIGLNISLPFEQSCNPYITPELNFDFHYFFIRKFWFTYLAKAIVIFPGGFGTMDEFFELITLIQTEKLKKEIPVVVYGSDFWKRLINFEVFVETGVISPEDLDLFIFADTPKEAYDYITERLTDLRIQRGKHVTP